MCSQVFKTFVSKNLHHHLGIYIFHGIYPSPQVKVKFKPQRVDKVHVNDFIYNLFGPNENCHNNNFRTIFACQNHLIKHSTKTKSPNCRVQPLIMLMQFILPLIWMLGVDFLMNEITMHFNGHYAEKKMITYKSKGGGL